MTVTRDKAEQVLAAIRTQFGADGYGEAQPQLVERYDWFGNGGAPFAVVWEEGPFEWTYRAFQGGVDEELTAAVQDVAPGHTITTPTVARVAGVYTEPMTTFALGIYATEEDGWER